MKWFNKLFMPKHHKENLIKIEGDAYYLFDDSLIDKRIISQILNNNNIFCLDEDIKKVSFVHISLYHKWEDDNYNDIFTIKYYKLVFDELRVAVHTDEEFKIKLKDFKEEYYKATKNLSNYIVTYKYDQEILDRLNKEHREEINLKNRKINKRTNDLVIYSNNDGINLTVGSLNKLPQWQKDINKEINKENDVLTEKYRRML